MGFLYYKDAAPEARGCGSPADLSASCPGLGSIFGSSCHKNAAAAAVGRLSFERGFRIKPKGMVGGLPLGFGVATPVAPGVLCA